MEPGRYDKMVGDNTKVGVSLGTLIPGFLLLLVAIFTLNIWATIFGFILFAIGIGIWSYALGSYQANYHHHNSNDYGSFYANPGGSANAKRKMWRRHQYSSRRETRR
jgi:hypothetical protein